MPDWKYEIDVSDVFPDDSLDVADKALIIAERIRHKFDGLELGSSERTVLHDLCDDLKLIGDEDEFDEVWEEMYVWAERNRLWIKTWGF
jgi:putative heme iron utilization protein